MRGKDTPGSPCQAQALWDKESDGELFPLPQRALVYLRTTNPIESPFAAVWLRTDAAKRFKKIENATAIIWKTLMVARRLPPA